MTKPNKFPSHAPSHAGHRELLKAAGDISYGAAASQFETAKGDGPC